MRRDGDLIPCSMTIALLAYPPRIVAFPRPESVPPLIIVVVVPRVGGLGTIFFQEQHLGSKARDHTFNLVWQPCSRHQRNHFAMVPHVATGSALAGFKCNARTAMAPSV